MVFMKLYMNKTLSIANELLSLFFNGEMEILPYIINENEFRIPCRSLESNIPNDDVSSCSGGQKAIMSMLLSYALLKQSSTKYNILKLDEIDATLDTSNRSNFLPVVNTIMKELDIETCLMVSHSSEIEMSDVDVVWLQPTDNEIPKGNIIFTYSDII